MVSGFERFRATADLGYGWSQRGIWRGTAPFESALTPLSDFIINILDAIASSYTS